MSKMISETLGEDDNDQSNILEGMDTTKPKRWIFVEGPDATNPSGWSGSPSVKTRVRIRIIGRAKALTPIIVGRVRNELIEKLELVEKLQWGEDGSAASGGKGMQMNLMNPSSTDNNNPDFARLEQATPAF